MRKKSITAQRASIAALLVRFFVSLKTCFLTSSSSFSYLKFLMRVLVASETRS